MSVPGRARAGVAPCRAVRSRVRLPGLAGVLALAACADGPPEPVPVDEGAWRDSVEAWHARRVEELEAPDSWLALVGLHWLEDGEHTLGSDSASDLVLPATAAPRVGTLEVAGGELRFRAEPGVRVTQGVDSTIFLSAGTGARPPDVASEPAVESAVLTRDLGPGKAVVLRHGDLNWIAHAHDGRPALRVRDNADPTYAAFTAAPVERFPVDPSWRVTARWVPQDKTVSVPNVVGTVAERASPARLEFWVDGERHALDVTGEEGAERYMLIFSDGTSGSETYGGGRYLWVDGPDPEGRVVIDFNLAYNPPCVWSEFATCPLPWPANRLTIPVRAGERDWKEEG